MRFASIYVLLVGWSICGRAESWSLVQTTSTANLHSVSIAKGNLAYAVGDKGAVLKSVNGGLTWTVQTGLGTVNNLYGVGTIDSVAVLACGAGSEMLYRFSADPKWHRGVAGVDTFCAVSTNWVEFDTSYTDNSGDGHNVQTRTMFACGAGGAMQEFDWVHHVKVQIAGPQPGYDTTYVTITPLPSETGATLRGMVLAKSYYAVGDRGTILISLNKGSSWVSNNLDTSIYLKSIAVIPSESGKLITVGNHGNVWISADFGATWFDDSPEGLSENLNGVHFADANTGVIVGDNGMILRTTDGGSTWDREATNTFAKLNSVYCYQHPDGIEWVAVGDSGTIVQTLFGGGTTSFTLAAGTGDTVNMGDIAVKTKKTLTVKFNNAGDGYLTLRLLSTDPELTFSPTRIVIDPQGTGQINVSFTPQDSNAKMFLTNFATDVDWIPYVLVVRARGLEAVVSLSKKNITLVSPGGPSNDTLQVRNTGNGPLIVSSCTLTGPGALVSTDFSGPMTIAPYDSGRIVVKLMQTVSTDQFATLILKSNAISGNDTVTISLKAGSAVDENSVQPSESAFNCYPNPIVQGEYAIVRMAARASMDARVDVVDESGRVVDRSVVRLNGEVDLPVRTTNLSRGKYFFRVRSLQGTLLGSGRFVIE